MSKRPTDWNDLQLLVGREQVRAQLLEQLRSGGLQPAANEPPGDSPGSSPAPSDNVVVAVPTLEQSLKRFAWTVPDGKVWDAQEQQLLKPSQLKNWIGAELYKQWHEHDERRVVDHATVARQAFAAQKKGGGDLAYYLQRYVLLYPSQSVWDCERREVVALNDLKPKLHKWYSSWLEHPDRQEIDRDKLVFDPLQQHSPEDGYINMFRGLPMKPRGPRAKCMAIEELVFHLVNEDARLYHWLMCWIAFPLQHVGAKMATAVLMHSETQGSGKSLFWEGVIKPLYGEYASTLGQHQLESQYTDWRSQKLFGLFEEVFSRDQKYSHTGTLKHMITGATHRIEKKFISGWEEANHMNAVFLSNEVQPFPVEPSDRRMFVVWPRRKLTEELKARVLAEIHGDGLAAFYDLLLSWPLEWVPDLPDGQAPRKVPFTTHTEPPMTPEKKRLIDFGRPSWDTFWEEWSAGELDVPFMTCLSTDLFKFYRRWCDQRKEHVISQTKFATLLSTRMRKRSGMRYKPPSGEERKGAFFLVEDPPADMDQQSWLGQQVAKFVSAGKLEREGTE